MSRVTRLALETVTIGAQYYEIAELVLFDSRGIPVRYLASAGHHEGETRFNVAKIEPGSFSAKVMSAIVK